MTNSPTAEWTQITPAIAAELIKLNHPSNRMKSKQHIDALARAMTAGTFMVTGDPIRFADSGELIDGQHRLTACIQADVPFTSLIVRNVPAEVMLHLDAGKKRTTQEQLAMATGTASHVTDCTLMLLRMGIGNDYRKVSTDDLARIIDHYRIITEVADAYQETAKFGLGGNIPAAELIMRGLGYHDRADAWRKVWATRVRDDDGAVAMAFRERLIINPELPRPWGHVDKRKTLPAVIERHMHPDGAVPVKWTIPQNVITFPLYTLQRLTAGLIDFAREDRAPLATISTSGGGIKSRTTHHAAGVRQWSATTRTQRTEITRAANQRRRADAAARLEADRKAGGTEAEE